MELRITPGFNKLYRLALIGPGDCFQSLSEHDTPRTPSPPSCWLRPRWTTPPSNSTAC